MPLVPIPTSPFDDEAVPTRTPTLGWGYRGCGPTSFTVQMADNDLFLAGRGSYVRSIAVDGSIRSTTWEPLVCQRTYYWRLSASAAGGTSAWSATTSFLTDC